MAQTPALPHPLHTSPKLPQDRQTLATAAHPVNSSVKTFVEELSLCSCECQQCVSVPRVPLWCSLPCGVGSRLCITPFPSDTGGSRARSPAALSLGTNASCQTLLWRPRSSLRGTSTDCFHASSGQSGTPLVTDVTHAGQECSSCRARHAARMGMLCIDRAASRC